MRSVTEMTIGREVRCRGVVCGTVTSVVWDPSRGKVTYLVVRPDRSPAARLVPVNRAAPILDWIEFDGTAADFRMLRAADDRLFARDGQDGWSERSDHVLVWAAAGESMPDRSLQAA